jgi:hypothetical protein
LALNEELIQTERLQIPRVTAAAVNLGVALEM